MNRPRNEGLPEQCGRHALLVCVLGFAAGAAGGGAQTLPLPPRSSDAAGGSAFVRSIEALSLKEREEHIAAEILGGNVPEFLRHLRTVTMRDGTNIALLHVTPNYLAIGSDADYFLAPMTPTTAQRIADATGCVLPTPKMVDAIHAAAGVHLEPQPISPSAAMTSVGVFAQHNRMVRTQLLARATDPAAETLVAGHKKDLVISSRLELVPGKVGIYGWHRPDGTPLQPLYAGHANTWVDYSHGVRLVQSVMLVNGSSNTVPAVLADRRLAALLSNEGVIHSGRYPTPSLFGESVIEFNPRPDVRVVINSPNSAPFNTVEPVKLVIFAVANGNTIEQTAGRRLRPGDDWHFDIQHIAAQMRWLRVHDTNHQWVVAYLEASGKSWPAWRRSHSDGDAQIREIVDGIAARFTNSAARIILAGHSGGGSFLFGFLNSVVAIPDRVGRIAFLDSDYAYDPSAGHGSKLARWLENGDHFLTVLAYNDSVALLDGKPFVSATGGTWYRSHLMQTNLAAFFPFKSAKAASLEIFTALDGRIQFLLKENPDRKILHTVQVEKNGFIHSMAAGTPLQEAGYEYLGTRAYERWLE